MNQLCSGAQRSDAFSVFVFIFRGSLTQCRLLLAHVAVLSFDACWSCLITEEAAEAVKPKAGLLTQMLLSHCPGSDKKVGLHVEGRERRLGSRKKEDLGHPQDAARASAPFSNLSPRAVLFSAFYLVVSRSVSLSLCPLRSGTSRSSTFGT